MARIMAVKDGCDVCAVGGTDSLFGQSRCQGADDHIDDTLRGIGAPGYGRRMVGVYQGSGRGCNFYGTN